MGVQILDSDIWDTTIVCSLGNQVSLTSFFYQCKNVVTGGINDLEWLTVFNTAVIPVLLPVLCNGTTYVGTYTQRREPLPILPKAVDKSATAPGTGGATPLPPQTSGITTWYTARAGRAQIARTYWPFPATAMTTTTGQPAGGTLTNYQTLATAVRTCGQPAVGFAGQCDMLLGVFHRGTGTIDAILTSFTTQKWATQKRRGAFGRPNASPI